jgi:foldase protein PrsA
MKSFSARVLAVIAVLSLIGNVFQRLHYSTSRPLVTVGGDVITKKQYQDQLEYQSGQAVLSKLVCDKLVAQAAARNGVTPTAQDVDAQIKVIERTQPQSLAPYAQDPAKMAEVRQDLQTALALENLRIKDVALTPAEVAAYYAKNKAKFTLPQQVQTTTVVTRNAVDAATATDLLRQKTPPDVIARQPRLNVVGANGYNPDMSALPPALRQQISGFVRKAKAGEAKTFRDGSYYLTFEVIKNNGATLPPLAQIRDQVERQARLERAPAPQAEMARLYQAAKPAFNSDRYAAYFDAFQKYPVGNDGAKKTASVP